MNYLFEWSQSRWADLVIAVGSAVFWWAVARAFFLYPRRELEPVERWYLNTFWLIALGPDLWLLLTGQHFDELTPLGYLDVCLALGALTLAIRRFLYSKGLGRRVIVPIFSIGAVLALSGGVSWDMLFARGIYTHHPDIRGIEHVFVVEGYIQLVVPLAFLLTGLHARRLYTAVADRLVRLRYDVSVDQIQAALRCALRDDRIEVLFWEPESGSYIDENDRAVAEPVVGAERIVVDLRAPNNERLGALIADKELERDVRLIGTAVNQPHAPLLPAWLHTARQEVRAHQQAMHREAERVRWTERERIGQDLHDQIQVRLATLGFPLKRIELHADDQKIAALASGANQDLAKILIDLKRIAHDLAPVLLATEGLRGAVAALVERQDISVGLKIPELRLPEHIERLAYSVIVEALSNATKHSQAQSLAITCGLRRGNLVIRIADDGIGGASLVGNGGIGLTGLQIRVEGVGGRFALFSPPTQGTTLIVRIPCV